MDQESQPNDQQDYFINEQYNNLIKQRQQQNRRSQLTYKNVSIWSEANYKPTKIQQTNKHKFNVYADKLLIHLVIQEMFDFQKIAQFLSYSFKNQGLKFTPSICSQRWFELHRDRDLISQIKTKQMQNKRIQSIMSMTDPFLLYNIQQKLHKMQKQEQSQNVSNLPRQLEYRYEGYNIFKDSIRKIDDMEKYNQLEKQMKQALKKASKQIQIQKPMLYTPYYQRLQHFQVLQEQLTIQKMQKMLSHPIQMELVQRELKVLDLNQSNYQSKAKKQIQKKHKQQRIKNQEIFEIQDDWDEYESD